MLASPIDTPALPPTPLAVVRFCAENRVTSPEALRAFRGSAGLWSYVAAESDDATYVFKRGAPSGGGAKAAAAAGKKKRAAEEDEGAEEAPAPASSRRKKA